jgi:hypothetical protein
MLIEKRIHGNLLAPLQPDGTPSHLFTHVLTKYDSGPDLDQIIASKASEMVENHEKIQFYLLQENSPTLTFKQAYNTD